MNEFAKTGLALGSAVILTIVAASLGSKEVRFDLFSDQGEEFWKGVDPESVAELEVAEFREGLGVYPFNVKRDDKGRWTIPSHGNYPADAKDRMGKAAALLIGLTKQVCVDDGKARHVEFGVVDPLDEGVETAGRGTRITLKDSAGNRVADLILGKEVEGKSGERYVRVPGKNRTYRTKIDGEVSTKFTDWIETDLLKAQSWDIAKITFDNYSVDETRGEIVPGEKLVVAKDSANKWSLDGLDAAKEEPNEEKLREIADTLGQIKIVGVRGKPEGLTAALERANGVDQAILAQMLQAKGYFLARGGKLYSNEGDLLFETKKGVRYTLRFGELVPGEGDEVTSGAEAKPGKPAKEGEKPADKAANNRYLMVTAEFVEALLSKPAGVRVARDQLDKRKAARTAIEAIVKAVDAYRAKNENKLPDSLAKLTEKPADGEPFLAELKKDPWDNDYVLQPSGDAFVVVSFAEDKAEGGEGLAVDVRSDRAAYEDGLEKEATAWSDYDHKVEEGKKEAEKLTKRFGPWYYVIDQALFAKLKPARKDLVKEKPATLPPANGATEPGK
ncbi:MAG: DUF4340 domain-containing protein [Planctomycetes bacterium]|nr:DUF4340 domain-containing protein [Planctomycetota bacterium]